MDRGFSRDILIKFDAVCSTVFLYDKVKKSFTSLNLCEIAYGLATKKLDIIKKSRQLGKGTYGAVWGYIDGLVKCAVKIGNIEIDKKDSVNPDYNENVSIRIGYRLNLFVLANLSPHIILTYSDVYCKTPKEGISRHITISEECAYDVKKLIEKVNINDDMISSIIIFQIIFTLAAIQKKFPTFKHNDLNYSNVFVKEQMPSSDKFFIYKLDNMIFKVPNYGFCLKIADFDLAVIPNLINNLILPIEGISDSYNPYYDIHYFFSPLLDKCKVGYMGYKNISSFVDHDLGDYRLDYPNELYETKEIGKVIPINVLQKSHVLDKFRVKDIPDSNVITIYDANRDLPDLYLGDYMKQFSVNENTEYIALMDNKNKILNMHDSMYENIAPLNKDHREYLESLKKKLKVNMYRKVKRLEKDPRLQRKYVNNFTDNKILPDDILRMTEQLALDFINTRRVELFHIDGIVMTCFEKLLYYFAVSKLEFPVYETLYTQIVIDHSFVKSYFTK